MNNCYQKMKEKLLLKKKNIVSDEDRKKYEIIDSLLKNPNYFFSLNFEYIIGILDYLGFEEEEALEIYNYIISPENYNNVVSKQRYGM